MYVQLLIHGYVPHYQLFKLINLKTMKNWRTMLLVLLAISLTCCKTNMVNNKVSSQWTTNGNDVYYNTGNVGVGTSSPSYKFHIKGTSDASQLVITANSIQSNTQPLLKFIKSDGTDLLSLHSDNINNVFLGLNAGKSNLGSSYNIFLGSTAEMNNISGAVNTFVGHYAGGSNTTGGSNTFLGKAAGASNLGSGNVFAGQAAGYTSTGSKKLYIENNSSNTPLIYGEFDNNIVGINGKLGIGTVAPVTSAVVEISSTTPGFFTSSFNYRTASCYCEPSCWFDNI